MFKLLVIFVAVAVAAVAADPQFAALNGGFGGFNQFGNPLNPYGRGFNNPLYPNQRGFNNGFGYNGYNGFNGYNGYNGLGYNSYSGYNGAGLGFGGRALSAFTGGLLKK